MVASAIVFLLLVLYFKNSKVNENKKITNSDLTYNLKGDELISDLVNRDSDKDGVLDWEEGLWGTDPNNKDTNGTGLGDKAEIEKQKAENNIGGGDEVEEGNLTQTDKFARELFATISTLNQTGTMDQATIDKITSTVTERIQNSVPRKIFSLTDIKTIKDDSVSATNKYNESLNALYKKYPINGNVLTTLAKLSGDEDTNADTQTLAELDPIIKQTTLFIDGLTKINTPNFLATKHLNFLNTLERILENLNDVKLFESDVIVALSGMSQYEQNSTELENTVTNLANAIAEKLNN